MRRTSRAAGGALEKMTQQPALESRRKRDYLAVWLIREEERINGMPLDDPGLDTARGVWQQRLRQYEEICLQVGEPEDKGQN